MPSSGIQKQKRFSHRRHISKPRQSLDSIAKEKRQSSLTQLDFVSTPRTIEVISIQSDEDDVEDFAVEQPRKKRRVSAKSSEGDEWTPRTSGKRKSANRQSTGSKRNSLLEKGQQTMTQIDFVPSSSRSMVVDEIEDDHEDLDNGHTHDARNSPIVSRHSTAKRTVPWLNQADDEMEHVPQSPVHSPARKCPLLDSHSQSDLAMHSIAAHDFTTPKKPVRNLEIPSSQSPPSIRLSTRRSNKSQRHALKQKSPSISPSKSASMKKNRRRLPLKEKSVNIAPPIWQPETQESQNPTMKMLQQVRLRTRMGGAPLHEEAPMPPPKKPQRTTAVGTSHTNVPTAAAVASPRKPKRTNTVQDSQASDENIATQAPPKRLTRTTTIQDSQHEDLDLSSQLYRSLSSRDNMRVAETQAAHDDTYDEKEDYDDDDDDDDDDDERDAEEEGGEEGEEDYPHTFDPVSAALERDAARYAWTQTQAPQTQRAAKTQIPDSEDESDEDDLDRGIVPDSDSEDEIILLPNAPTRQEGPSQEIATDDLEPSTPKAAEAPKQDPDNLEEKEKEKEKEREKEKEVSSPAPPPSSPPPIRPSQASTVLPTQQSSPHRNHDLFPEPMHEGEGESESEKGEDDQFYTPAPPSQHRLVKNPQAQQQQETQALTVSSSPLPLPPWSSSGEVDLGFSAPKGGERGGGGGEFAEGTSNNNELASLVDFSLPPPPPLGMSSSPWR